MKIRYLQYFFSFVIVLASVRGALIYNFGVPPNVLYPLSSALLVCFGFLSMAMATHNADKTLVFLRNAVRINSLLISFYMLVSIVFISQSAYEAVYLFSIFPIIFMLIQYNEKLLSGIIYAIALITTFGVFYFYQLGISGGFDAIVAAHSILRPEKFSYARVGENLLPAGYQGSHHDAANIMTMCSVFFLSKTILTSKILKKYLYLSGYFLISFATLLTSSASNIVILLAFSAIAIIVKQPYVRMPIFGVALLFLPLILDSMADYLYFLEKFHPDMFQFGDNSMLNSLDLNSIILSFHAIFSGFGYALEVPMLNSEVSFVKLLIDLGLISFLVLMSICFSPLYYIRKFRKNYNAKVRELKSYHLVIPTANFLKIFHAHQFRLVIICMPALAGAMTLVHYGSLFRVTSIGLFCVMLALFFKEYLAVHNFTLIPKPNTSGKK
jgi:hypothetical protein